MVQVGGVTELPPRTMAEINVLGRKLLVCNFDGAIYGVHGICPHRGAALAQGALDGHTVVCPWHAWDCDCRTGEVVVRDGIIHLDA